MTRTLFSKMMIAFIAVIVITTVLSTLFVSTLIQNQKIQDAEVDMVKMTQEVNQLASLKYSNVITSRQLYEQLVKKAEVEDSVIWVVENSSILVTSEVNIEASEDATEPELTQGMILEYYGDMVSDISQGRLKVDISRDSKFFDVPVITVGAPLVDVYGQIIGSVFVHKNLSAVTESLIDIRVQLIIAGLISILIAIILCYFFSRNLLKPLRHVANAARQLSKGNFDVRIDNTTGDEVGMLASTINQVSEDLGKYEHTRQTFVANVSHDLRSPLTSMQGFVQGVIDGTIPEDQKNYYLGIVLDEIKRLNLLINDLLDLSRLEAGTFPMNITEFDICELARRTIITFESKIREGKIDVDIDIPDGRLMVSGDSGRITQVLMNLADNAVKFTPEGGKITLRVDPRKDFVFVSVRNTGSYISKEDIKFLFERFFKTDKSRNRTKQGTGLGLSIAKKIISQHGQNIWVESSKRSGTVFTFTLKKVSEKSS